MILFLLKIGSRFSEREFLGLRCDLYGTYALSKIAQYSRRIRSYAWPKRVVPTYLRSARAGQSMGRKTKSVDHILPSILDLK
jgi:hypothetical protein